jgi:2,5-dioxopentanoate dehydrogenase
MVLTGSNLIAGAQSHSGPQTFTSINPRTRAAGDVLFHDATPAEINQAVEAAAEAYRITRNYPAEKLADFLDAVADEIEALGDALLETADMETGLGTTPRLAGERGRTTNQLRAFGNLLREGSYVEAIIDTAQPDRQPAPRPDIRRMLFPIGAVAVFPPNNFPLAFSVAGGDTASAFAAGCPVIVKAHPSHPATSELVGQTITRVVGEYGFPPGFFSLLQGKEIQVGQALISHPGLEAVAFTGSLRGGRAIYNSAASRPRPIPVYAEMGSINPVVVLPGAIAAGPDQLAGALVDSVTLGAGQYCTSPGLVLVLDSPETDRFIEKVTGLMAARQPGVLLNAAVEQGLVQAVSQTMERPAVQTLTGGQPVDNGGYCYTNTVLQTTAAAFRADDSLQEEHFGPVTLFVKCESINDLKATVDALHGNLTGSVHAADDERETVREVFDLLRERVGRVILNGFPTGVEVIHAMQHGGPYPASTVSTSTSVGMTAIKRFLRPVAFQNLPDELLPDALKNANPLYIWRIVNGEYTREPLE